MTWLLRLRTPHQKESRKLLHSSLNSCYYKRSQSAKIFLCTWKSIEKVTISTFSSLFSKGTTIMQRWKIYKKCYLSVRVVLFILSFLWQFLTLHCPVYLFSVSRFSVWRVSFSVSWNENSVLTFSLGMKFSLNRINNKILDCDWWSTCLFLM